MNIPRKIKDAFATTSAMMLASLGVSQAQLDGASAAFWKEIEGHGLCSITERKPLDRILTRRQASELLARSVKTVSSMVAAGKLKGVYGGAHGQRLTGITESSLRAFAAGAVNASDHQGE